MHLPDGVRASLQFTVLSVRTVLSPPQPELTIRLDIMGTYEMGSDQDMDRHRCQRLLGRDTGSPSVPCNRVVENVI